MYLKYFGKIKNPQELNVKNIYDLIEYLKPCFIYAESDIKTVKERIKEEHIDDLATYQNYYFDIGLVLSINKPPSSYEYEINLDLGFVEYGFKEKIYFYVSLNANEIKNYIERGVEELPITCMFNTKPISFYVVVSIYRFNEYMEALHDEWVARNSGSESDESDDDTANTMNKKRIINAEQTFKEDECVICLTKPPNVLFCNCGHIAICAECSRMDASLKECPICKTEKTILRIIE